jgi:hypothetical protein
MTESQGLVPAVLFLTGILLVFGSRIALYLALRRRVPRVSLFFFSVFPYLESIYLQHRPRIRTRTLDALAALAFLSFLGMFLSAAILWNLLAQPGEAVPPRGS